MGLFILRRDILSKFLFYHCHSEAHYFLSFNCFLTLTLNSLGSFYVVFQNCQVNLVSTLGLYLRFQIALLGLVFSFFIAPISSPFHHEALSLFLVTSFYDDIPSLWVPLWRRGFVVSIHQDRWSWAMETNQLPNPRWYKQEKCVLFQCCSQDYLRTPWDSGWLWSR